MPCLRGMIMPSLVAIFVNVFILTSGTSTQSVTPVAQSNRTTGNTTWGSNHTSSQTQRNRTTGNTTWMSNHTTPWATTFWTNSSWQTSSTASPAGATACPTNLHLLATSTSQYIVSPNHPRRYYNRADCSWHISAPPNSSVQFNVLGYEIESHSTCGYDALEIFNGNSRNSPRVARICGQGSYTLNSTHMTEAFVWFHTDGSVTRNGFQLNFWTGQLDSQGDDQVPDAQDGQPCDGTPHVLQATSDLDFLESPGYPDSYSNRMNCSWIIQFPEDMYLRISIVDFELESHYRCGYDALDIYNVDSSNVRHRMASLCGSRSTGSYRIENKAYLHFHTDYSVTRKGFKLSYEVTDEPPEAQPCDGGLLVLQAPEDPLTIVSQNYPANYPNYANCSWLIQASPGHQVKVTFTDFRLEYHYRCSYDAVEIFDGRNRGATLLAKLCSSLTRTVYGSSSSAMYMNFHTDYSVRYRGFSLSYMEVEDYHPACQGQTLSVEASASPRSLVSPAYSNDLDCQWLITTSYSHSVLISVEDVRLQNSPNCSSGALQLFDGNNQYNRQLANFCGEIPSGSQEFFSRSSSVFVRFRSDHSQNSNGFNITYRSVDENYIACHRGPLELQVSQYSTEVISSYGYPNYAFNYADCQWKVESTLDFVQVTVNHNDIGSQNNCSDAALEIYDGINDAAPLLFANCHTIPRHTFTSSSRTVFIRFHSTESNIGRRFRLTFKGLDTSFAACLGTPLEVRAESFAKSFTSPNHPSHYPNNARCKWLIRSTTPYTKLSWDQLGVESHSSCGFDALQVYAGSDSESVQLANWCGHHYERRVIISTSNTTYVYFHTDGSVTSTGFNLSYQALEDYDPACSGEVHILPATSQLRSFKSPGYPAGYNNNVTCSWQVQLPSSGGFVSLRVDDINLGNDHNCSWDRLEIDNGYELFATLCGQNSSNYPVYRSSGRAINVRFISDESATHPGFRASYRSHYFEGCHGSTAWIDANSTGGILQSPFYPSNYTNDANCRWTIRSETGLLLMHVEDSSLGYSSYCYRDYLEIYEGSYGNRLARICGNDTSHMHAGIVSSSGSTTIRFHSDYSGTDRGFRVRYQSVTAAYLACSADEPLPVWAYSNWKNITSPNYPDAYPAASKCSWVIQSGEPYVIIKVEFLRFPAGSACADSSLEIFEGANQTSHSLVKHCDGVSPDSNEFIASSSMVLIQFNSTASVANGGFRLTYRSASFIDLACSSSSFRLQASHESKHISFARYIYNDSPFDSPASCSWRIWSPTGFVRVIVGRTGFYNYSWSPCSGGYLEIHDGADGTFPRLGRVCETGNNEGMFTGTSGELYLHMNQMTRARYVRLNFEYSIVDERIPACLGAPVELRATPSPQVIDFSTTSSNVLCRWRMSSEEDFMFVSFQHLDVGCGYPNYNSMRVYDGELNSYRYRDMCYTSQQAIWSATNLTMIRFRSSTGTNVTHFRMMYRSVNENFRAACLYGPEYLYAESHEKTLQSPGYPVSYFDNIDCTWSIASTPDTLVRVTFQDLSLQPDSNCSDYVTIHDNMYYYNYEPVAKLCGGDPAAQTYLSSTSMIYIHFHTNNYDTSNGFQLTYDRVDSSLAACQNPPRWIRIDYGGGSITSPGYPYSYPNNSTCAWKIEVPSGRVLLSVVELQIDGSTGCSNDAVEFFDGTSPDAVSLGKLCGTHSSSRYISSSSAMYVQFHSDSSSANSDGSSANHSSGFNLAYNWIPQEFQGCFGPPLEVNVNSTPNVLSLYGSPIGNESVNCGWHLKSNTGFIRVLVYEVRSAWTPDCVGEALYVFDGASNTSQNLARLCGRYWNYNLTSYRSTSNEMFIQFNYIGSARFRLLYTNVEPHQACQGQPAILNATSEAKTLESPGYPVSYPNDAYCTWQIRAANRSIDLYIIHAELEMSNECANDSVEIFDGPDESARSLRLVCGRTSLTSNYTTIRSSSDVLFIRFRTDNAGTFPGFFLVYGTSSMWLPSLFY